MMMANLYLASPLLVPANHLSIIAEQVATVTHDLVTRHDPLGYSEPPDAFSGEPGTRIELVTAGRGRV